MQRAKNERLLSTIGAQEPLNKSTIVRLLLHYLPRNLTALISEQLYEIQATGQVCQIERKGIGPRLDRKGAQHGAACVPQRVTGKGTGGFPFQVHLLPSGIGQKTGSLPVSRKMPTFERKTQSGQHGVYGSTSFAGT